MDYVYLEPMIEKVEYEERVRWLQSLYGNRTKPAQPGQVTRVAGHLLCILGRSLMSLGERLEPRDNIHPASPTAIGEPQKQSG